LSLPAIAAAPAAFVCVTAPLSPELKIRTSTLRLLGATWVAFAEESADCSLPDCCPEICVGACAAAVPAPKPSRSRSAASNAHTCVLIDSPVEGLTVRVEPSRR
jgi:hypothetical protein